MYKMYTPPLRFRNKLRSYFFLLIAVFALAQVSRADDLTPAKKDDINALLKLTGTDKQARRMGTLMVQQMLQVVRQSNPNLPVRALEIMEQEVKITFEEGIDAPNGLMARIVPIYSEFFSHAEIKEMLVFHRSSVGQKIFSVQEDLFAKSVEAGRQWSEASRPEFEQRIRARLRLEGLDDGPDAGPEQNQ